MPDTTEESWFDLAEELGVVTPKPVKAEMPPPLPVMEEPPPVDVAASLFDEVSQAEPGIDAEVTEAGGESESDHKRRRRRRRKKKGDPSGEGPAEEGQPVAVAATPEEHFTQPRELLREIIAHWDVPGWDEIIGGLHRPHR